MPTIRELANAIRFLSIDAIQKANSGHPGMPLGMADIATVLWKEFLRHDPTDPKWLNRDRFILSNGHGSMLHYALLHLTGYELTISHIKNFRQLHAKTPGHPELGCAPGIETTTGPLGQGFANAVGMALAEKVLAAEFNQKDFPIIDHYTYVFVGDGCLMEGISHEVASLAGTHQLNKLIAFWDDNHISIDGDTKNWFTDDTTKRFESYGWNVIPHVDAYDADQLRKAITAARNEKHKPTLICCKTIIGFGAPNICGLHDCHGSPLGTQEILATRKNLNWPYPPFAVPDELYQAWDSCGSGRKFSSDWRKLFNAYKEKYPELAQELLRRIAGKMPTEWQEKSQEFLQKVCSKPEAIATRKASQNCLENFGPLLPELFGGSADLTGSNLTNWKGSVSVTKENPKGNYLHYGVREFGMCAMMNGIALHGGFIPYGGTFLVFADYARNAMRLSAMMQQKVIFVLSHDSIGLGEDGPTHQPIEHLAMLRLTPNMIVWRPADDLETAVAWKFAIEHQGPTCLSLTRQKVNPIPRDPENKKLLENIARGGYVLLDSKETPECIIIATGSEVEIAVAAHKKLTEQGKNVRVVSMPSTNIFDQQDAKYKEAVLPKNVVNRVAIEAAAADFWYKYVGLNGKIIGMHTFGESAPAPELYNLFGITVDNLVNTVLEK